MRGFTAIVTLGALVLAWAACPAAGGYIPVFGGPTYDSSTGTGYGGLSVFVPPTMSVYDGDNDTGTAVNSAKKYVSGVSMGYRPVRWDASGTAATELGNLGTTVSGSTDARAYSVNNAGTTVGYAQKYVDGADKGYRAVRWDASGTVATELGNLGTATSGSTSSRAYSLNNAGTAVGFASRYDAGVNKGYCAVRWGASGTAATELGNLGSETSGYTQANAYAINDVGTAAGYARKYVAGVAKEYRAVRWDAAGTAATELEILGTDASGYTYAQASAINNAGTAVGYAQKFVDGTDMGYRAVRWDGSGTAVTELGNLGTDPSGFADTDAVAVNSAGTAVGYAEKYVSGVNKNYRAVRWDASSAAAIELGNLGTSASGITYTRAYSLNDAGTTVGGAGKYDGTGAYLGSRAVLWGLDGAAVDLNTLIDPASGWTLTEANAISNTGWISGFGSYDPDGAGPMAAYDRLFLVQVPEPATLALVALGGVAAMLRRRK